MCTLNNYDIWPPIWFPQLVRIVSDVNPNPAGFIIPAGIDLSFMNLEDITTLHLTETALTHWWQYKDTDLDLQLVNITPLTVQLHFALWICEI